VTPLDPFFPRIAKMPIAMPARAVAMHAPTAAPPLENLCSSRLSSGVLLFVFTYKNDGRIATSSIKDSRNTPNSVHTRRNQSDLYHVDFTGGGASFR